MDNFSSIADFIPALDFLATKSRRIAVKNGRDIDNYGKRVCSLLSLRFLPPCLCFVINKDIRNSGGERQTRVRSHVICWTC